MKCNLRLWHVFFMLAVFSLENSAKAQNTSFSQMNGLQPISQGYPQEQSFMSAEDMNVSQENDVGFSDVNELNLRVQQNDFVDQNMPQNNENIRTTPKANTLTDTLQQQTKQRLSGTWVDQLATSVPQAISSTSSESQNTDFVQDSDNTLQSLMNQNREQSSRSNASVFDISGVMLRMTLPQAEKAMLVRGFKKISQKLEIPNFIKWRNEETCRNNGVVGYERLMNCVVELAQKHNYQYVETAKFVKYSTQEEVELKLTSNFTGNKIYRIMYKSSSGKVVGSGPKAAYLRNIKVFDFWKKVNQKYGNPDNKEEVTWGLGMNKPYMKASTGFLVLEDPMLRELDYTRMSREDQRFMNTDLYSF